jgi:hypothetical protein
MTKAPPLSSWHAQRSAGPGGTRRHGPKPHPLGYCTCLTHIARPWNRPEHWTAAEVGYLEAYFGRIDDLALRRHLNRSIVGIRLKAKRLGLLKRDAGYSGRAVAQLLGVDDTVVSKVWIKRGLLHSRRAYRQGPYRVHIVSEKAVAAFIREHGQYVDLDKVPSDSPFRALAAANAFLPLPEVCLQTGHAEPCIHRLIASGVIRAARRGSWWYVRAADVALIPHRSPDACAESRFRRESVLEARRNRRKGVGRRAA